MEITLNGERRVTSATSIADLLCALNLDKDMVAIELNSEIVHRHTFEERKIEEKDRIEIITVVGGG